MDPYWDLWLLDLKSGKKRRLGPGRTPSWSPSGRYLVAVDGDAISGHALVLYDVQTFEGKRLSVRKGSLAFEETTSEDMPSFFAASFSPDGKWVVFFGESVPFCEEGLWREKSGLFIAPFQENGVLGSPRLLRVDVVGVALPVRLYWLPGE
jgi:Tol biopolymer transport system component